MSNEEPRIFHFYGRSQRRIEGQTNAMNQLVASTAEDLKGELKVRLTGRPSNNTINISKEDLKGELKATRRLSNGSLNSLISFGRSQRRIEGNSLTILGLCGGSAV